MVKLFINAIVFALAVQLTCYIFWAFDIFGGMIKYPLGDITAINGIFNIDAYTALIGIGGAAAIGLAALLLRQGVYAIYAMLLWAIGTMFGVVRSFVLVIPNTVGALLPPSTNPNPALFSINPLVVVISSIFAFGAWMYLFGLVIQRNPSQ
jgi:hypothetical protein